MDYGWIRLAVWPPLVSKQDHRAVFCPCRLIASEARCPGWSAGVNFARVRCPEVQASWWENWEEAPALPSTWTSTMMEKAYRVKQNVMLIDLCPIKRSAPRQPWVSEVSWCHIESHVVARRAFFKWPPQVKFALLSSYFAAWRTGKSWDTYSAYVGLKDSWLMHIEL